MSVGYVVPAAIAALAALPTYPGVAARAENGLWQMSAPSPGFDCEVLWLSMDLGLSWCALLLLGICKDQIDVFFCLSKSISCSGFNAI